MKNKTQSASALSTRSTLTTGFMCVEVREPLKINKIRYMRWIVDERSSTIVEN